MVCFKVPALILIYSQGREPVPFGHLQRLGPSLLKPCLVHAGAAILSSSPYVTAPETGSMDSPLPHVPVDPGTTQGVKLPDHLLSLRPHSRILTTPPAPSLFPSFRLFPCLLDLEHYSLMNKLHILYLFLFFNSCFNRKLAFSWGYYCPWMLPSDPPFYTRPRFPTEIQSHKYQCFLSISTWMFPHLDLPRRDSWCRHSKSPLL